MRDLTPKEARRLQGYIASAMTRLRKTARQMDRAGIDPQSPIYKSAQDAWNAVHALNVHLHYRACDMKEWEPPKGGL